MREDLQRIFEFIIEVDKLKDILRKTKPVGFERYENSAEHSWQVCLLAQLLAQHAKERIDIVRGVEILLVHDIPEIDAGDQIVYQGGSEARTASELAAAQRIFGLLPEPQASWCMARWQEYEVRESREATFAYAIDRLMPLLQNLKNNGQSWRENKVPLDKVLAFNAAIGKACPSIWEYAQELIGQAAQTGVFEHEKQEPNDRLEPTR